MIQDFVNVYKKSIPARKLPSNLVDFLSQNDSENFKIFSSKTGLPVTLCQTKKVIREIYPIKSHYGFFEKHKYFWMIPIVTINKKIVGFIIRGCSVKEYRTIFVRNSICPMFGWEDFKNYDFNKPIVLCEGAKDSIYLKKYYPYTLALNTSNITSLNLNILKKFTNNLILCYDNDSTGSSSIKMDGDLLNENKINFQTIVVEGSKDWAEQINLSEDIQKGNINKLYSKIQLLGGVIN